MDPDAHEAPITRWIRKFGEKSEDEVAGLIRKALAVKEVHVH
jgi:hypothetical protein